MSAPSTAQADFLASLQRRVRALMAEGGRPDARSGHPGDRELARLIETWGRLRPRPAARARPAVNVRSAVPDAVKPARFAAIRW